MLWPGVEPGDEQLSRQMSHAAVAGLLGSFNWRSQRWGLTLGRAAEYMLVQVVVPRGLAQAAERGSNAALLLKLKSDWHTVVVQVV